MVKNKTLSLLLFGSLGLNIFLGGALGGQLLTAADTDKAASDEAPSEKANPKRTQEKSTQRSPHRSAHGPRKGAPHRADQEAVGPSGDLLLLRRMVRIMGGPGDARIKQLRDKKKDEIQRMRSDIHAAHERVRHALAAEEGDQEELSEALKNLRKTTFEAQARAQEGIVILASLMTPEERKKLRESAPPHPPERAGERKVKQHLRPHPGEN